MMLRKSGWRSYRTSFGHIEQHLEGQQERPLFQYRMGAKAVIPLKTGFPTLRTSTFTSNGNDELLKKSLDLVEERRKNAMVQLAYYQHKLK